VNQNGIGHDLCEATVLTLAFFPQVWWVLSCSG